jgi:hypothetical protein
MSNAPEAPSWREGRPPFGVIGLFLVLYLLTRALTLNALPIFLDEAVHLQWAERLYSEGRVLRPIGSGRLLAVVAYGLALPFEDRLGAARLIAAMAGAVTLGLTMLLAHRLCGVRASVIAGTLYVLSPFALVYDRLALSDGFLSACITGLMLGTWTLVQRPDDVRPRLIVAALMGLAVASKVSALLFLLTIPLAVAALAPDRRRSFRSAVVACVAGFACAAPMLWFFARNSGEISSQHIVDTASVASTIVSTLGDMREWALSYFTLPALLIGAVSVLALRDGRALWLLGSAALPFVLFALFSQPWSARYILPTLPPFLILLSGGIEHLASRFKPAFHALAAAALVSFALLAWLPFDRELVLDPSHAPFPADDRRQLVTGWPAGYGVRELAVRLEQEARTAPLTTYVDTGGTRTFATGLAIFVGSNPSIRLVEGDFGSEAVRASMVGEMKTGRVFAVVGPRSTDLDFKSQVAGAAVERVEVYQRPGGEWAATLFRLRGLAF